MTKPSDFIFSSDYLALAESNKQIFFLNIPSIHYNQDQQGYDTTTSWSTDITTNQSDKGSIDEFYVTINDKTYFGDIFSTSFLNALTPTPYLGAQWFAQIERISTTKIKLSFVFVPDYQVQGTTTTPMAITIRLVSFKPPNVF